MVCTCFYDENDNFNDKRFILTSYNKAVKIEEKNKHLIWFVWTEKRYFPNGVKKLSYSGEREKTEYRNYYKIIHDYHFLF